MKPSSSAVVSGIAPLDERAGGLEAGGTYLVMGAPGPAKMVAALQFLHAGVRNGERCLLVSSGQVGEILSVARAWGFDLAPAWESGLLQVIGFRDDFEQRVIGSAAPEQVLDELGLIVAGTPARIAVDPGSTLLAHGARTRLGAAFVSWAKRQPATVLATFSADDGEELPPHAEWLLDETTALLVVSRSGEALYQLRVSRTSPGPDGPDPVVTLELRPGAGLAQPERAPARRAEDRRAIDPNRLLLLSLGEAHAMDLESWVARSFDADVVSEASEAVARVQAPGGDHGCLLIHAARRSVRDAIQACRTLRPLTRAAIVFASDDTIRSSDRVRILEAGADDCLNGGLDFRELGLRIRQAMASTVRPPTPDEAAAPVPAPAGPDSGRLSTADFAREAARRARDPDMELFGVVEISVGRGAPRPLADRLVELVRSEEGDLVAEEGGRCLVLVQGARATQLAPFVERLRDRLSDGARTALEVTALSHPADAARIRTLLGSDGTASIRREAP